MALFNVFRAENYLNSEKWWGGGRGAGERECLPMGNKVFIAVSVFPVELLAYQAAMVSTVM